MTREEIRRSRRKINVIWLGIGFSLSYWTLEAIRDVIVFQKGSFFNQLLSPGSVGVWTRMVGVLVILLFSFYIRSQIIRREKAEEALRDEHNALERQMRAMLAMKTFSETNKSIIHATDIHGMLQDVCDIIIKVGGYHSAWVALIEDNRYGDNQLGPVIRAGSDHGQLKLINTLRQNTGRHENPVHKVLRTGKPCVTRNLRGNYDSSPFSYEVARKGFATSITLPLMFRNITVGVMSVYAKEGDAFDSMEGQILKELSDDLAFGIVSQQMRITQHDIEEERNQIQARLMQLQNRYTVGMISGELAHYFNNLMTAISGTSDLVSMEVDPEENIYKDLKQIKGAAKEASEINQKVLHFKHLEPSQFETVSISNVLKDIHRFLDRLVGENIQVTLDPHLSDHLISGDPGAVEQLLVHLTLYLKKAMTSGGYIHIKYSDKKLDKKKVKNVQSAYPGHFLELSFQFTSADIQDLAVPFDQHFNSNINNNFSLLLVNQIVEKHRGWIKLKNQENQLELNLYFPKLQGAEPVNDVKTVPEKEIVSGHGERILVVEDEESIREFAERVLGKSGYEVHCAASAEEAYNLFENKMGDFHLIMSDVMLPDANGLDLVERMLLKNPDLKILLSSGYTEHTSHWYKIQERGFQFLPKPYDYDGLLRMVQSVVH